MPEREPAVDDVAQVPLVGLGRDVVRALQDADGRVADRVVARLAGDVVRRVVVADRRVTGRRGSRREHGPLVEHVLVFHVGEDRDDPAIHGNGGRSARRARASGMNPLMTDCRLRRLVPMPGQGRGVLAELAGRREGVLAVDILEDGQADVAHVAGALGAAARLAGGLDGGQEQPDEDADDADHHQQFDQREAAMPTTASLHESVLSEKESGLILILTPAWGVRQAEPRS